MKSENYETKNCSLQWQWEPILTPSSLTADMFLIDMDPHHQDEGYTAEQGPTLPAVQVGGCGCDLGCDDNGNPDFTSWLTSVVS